MTYRVSGALFAGSIKALLEFADIHFNTINDAKTNKVFSGDDQYLYSFDIIRNPHLFKLISTPFYFGSACIPMLPGTTTTTTSSSTTTTTTTCNMIFTTTRKPLVLSPSQSLILGRRLASVPTHSVSITMPVNRCSNRNL